MQGYSDVSQMLQGGNQPTLNMEKHNNEYSSPNFNNKCYVILDGEFILKPLSDFGRIY